MSKTVILRLTAHHKDNGDGSTSVFFYNDEEHLIKDLKEECEWEDEQIQELFDEEDPYENGRVTTVQLKLNVSDDGVITLAEPFITSSDG